MAAKAKKHPATKLLNAVAVLLAVIVAAPLIAPQALAFPFKARVGQTTVWSVEPLPEQQLHKVIKRSNALVAESPIAQMPEGRRVFLTDGGWRWKWLAIGAWPGFGLTRAVNDSVIINRSDLAADRVYNGAPFAGERSLSGVIAHETCHGIVRREFGIFVGFTKPEWLTEGYCDYVAQESTLSEEQVNALKAKGSDHRAIPYYEGHQRVARELSENDGSVGALFAAY